MVYAKERDALETVCIKEICIHKDYRQRGVAKIFLRRMCNNVFRTYGYSRVCFTASNFHATLDKILKKKTDSKLIKNIQSWKAWGILPGINDQRTVYTLDISDLNKN